MKHCVSATKSVSAVLTLLRCSPKCLTMSPPYPSLSQDKLLPLMEAEQHRSLQMHWRPTVPRSTAVLHPCSAAGISWTLCYMRVSSVEEQHGHRYGTWGRGWGALANSSERLQHCPALLASFRASRPPSEWAEQLDSCCMSECSPWCWEMPVA